MRTKSTHTKIRKDFIQELTEIVTQPTINPTKLEALFNREPNFDLRAFFSDVKSKPNKYKDIYLSFKSIFSIDNPSPTLRYIKSLIRLSLSEESFDYTKQDAFHDCYEAAKLHHPGGKFMYGTCLYFGNMTRRNQTAGREMIQQAIVAGSNQAFILMQNLKPENESPNTDSRKSMKRIHDSNDDYSDKKWTFLTYNRIKMKFEGREI